jgi:hypothetical protein
MSPTYLAYLGALSAAWAAMGGFCLRSGAIRHLYGWAPLSRRDDALRVAAAGALCAASLLLVLRVDVVSFALILWFILLAFSGVLFAVLLPFWTRTCRRSLGVAAALACAAGLGFMLR